MAVVTAVDLLGVHRQKVDDHLEQVPPKVVYSVTEFGRSLNDALVPLGEWGEEHMETLVSIPRSGSGDS